LPVDNPAIQNLNMPVRDFIAKYRKASVAREFPGDLIEGTVRQALRTRARIT
jgi:hypothetical protein